MLLLKAIPPPVHVNLVKLLPLLAPYPPTPGMFGNDLQAFFRLVYATDPLEVTWTFVAGFFGQKERGIKVDSWITEYNRLHNDKESR